MFSHLYKSQIRAYVSWIASRAFATVVVGTVFIFAVVGVRAQDGSNLEIVFRADVGQRFTVRIERTREVTKKGKAERTQATIIYNGRVEKELETGWLISWRMTDMRTVMPDGSTSDNMSEPYASLPMLFDTDEYGEPQTLVNADEWRVLTGKILKADISMLDRLFTPEALHQMYLQEPLLLSKFQGVILSVDQTLHQDIQLPSPFGDGTIAAETMATVTSLDREKGVATARFVLRFKPESATEVAKAFIAKLMEDQGKSQAEIDAGLKEITFEVFREDTIETSIDLKTGWPIETNARREVRTGERGLPSGKLDVWKINITQLTP